MKLTHKILGIAFIIMLAAALVLMIKIKLEMRHFMNERTVGNQQWEKLDVQLSEFDGLEASEHFVVRWHKGSPAGKISVENNLKNYVKIDQQGSFIKIHMDSIHNYKMHGDIVIDVYSSTLNRIQLNDFVRFQAMDTVQTTAFQILMGDHSEASLVGHADSVQISLNDFAELQLKGRSAFTKLVQSDHSECDAEEFQAKDCDADLQDFSSGKMKVLNYLKVVCSGHSEFKYSGDSIRVESNERDFGSIEKYF